MPTDPLPDWVPARRQRIGRHIARLRAEQRLAVDEVARRTGLDRKTVMTVESGANAPTLDTLLLIADALGVPASSLLDDGPAAATGGAGDGAV